MKFNSKNLYIVKPRLPSYPYILYPVDDTANMSLPNKYFFLSMPLKSNNKIYFISAIFVLCRSSVPRVFENRHNGKWDVT